MLNGVPDVIISAKFYVNRSRGFSGAAPPKMPFPILIRTTLTTVLHYRADCDHTQKHGLLPPHFTSPALHVNHTQKHGLLIYIHNVHLLHYTSITQKHGLLTPHFTPPALHINHTQKTWPSTSTLYISRITRQSHTEYMAFYLHAVHLLHYTSITPTVHGL